MASFTVTCARHDDELPYKSVSVKVTGHVEPCSSEQLKSVRLMLLVARPQASVLLLSTCATVSVPWPVLSRKTIGFLHNAVGGVLSLIVTLAVHVAELPPASVALSVTVLMPIWEQLNMLGVTIKEKKQLSVLPLFTDAGSKVKLPLTPKFSDTFLHFATGGVKSFKVTVNEQLAALLLPSLAVSVTNAEALCPVKLVVGGGVWVTVIDPLGVQLSLKETGAQEPSVPEHVPFAGMIWLGGQMINGAWVSFTVTVKAQVALLLAPSVTLKVFVVTPTGNVAPEARPVIRVVVWPEQLSVPTGEV